MIEPDKRALGPGLISVAVLALILAVPVYFATQIMDVGGNANMEVGLSAAVLLGIACVGALVGFFVIWVGRKRTKANTRIALVATAFTFGLLLMITYGASTSSVQPASTTVERS
jgi:hypothetical protein